MTAVVEIGPITVRGAEAAHREQVSQAIDCIDDPVTLVAESPVEVAELWCDILRSVTGDSASRVVLVVPTWWPAIRLDILTRAAHDVFDEVVVVRRAELLRCGTDATVVELSDDVVVLARPDDDVVTLARDHDALADALCSAGPVLLDVPVGVAPLPGQLAVRLRAQGATVSYTDRRAILRVAALAIRDDCSPVPHAPARPGRGRVAVLVGAGLALAVLAGAVVADHVAPPVPAVPSTVLVEGRAAVQVPAQWRVQRITSGPGSARVRVAATAGTPALHITQAAAAPDETLEHVAEILARAVASEDPGVFAEFDPAGHVGGRPAVTYRERRGDSETAWAVVVDGSLRIAIGCQSASGHLDAVREACEQAVASAHAVR